MSQQEGNTDYFIKAIASLNELVDWGTMTPIESVTCEVDQGLAVFLKMLFCGGPFFQLADNEDVKVIANYGVNDEAAVVLFDLGEGKVLLMGPHPELGYRFTNSTWNVTGGDGAQWEWLRSLLELVL